MGVREILVYERRCIQKIPLFTVKAINDLSFDHDDWNCVLRKVSTNNAMSWEAFVRSSTESLKWAGPHYFVNEKDKEGDLKKMANIVRSGPARPEKASIDSTFS